MESITGLSRPALIALAVAVVLGVAASTVAGSIASRGQPGCPDLAYRCATFKPGEALVLGVLLPETNGPGVEAIRQVVQRYQGSIRGRPVEVESFGSGCTPEGATNGVRELATDEPDGPPVIAVIGGACPEAAVPAAQILSDSGITLVLPTSVDIPPTAGPTRYALRAIPDGEPSSIAAVADRILRTAGELAIAAQDGEVLIPRTPLRDALARAFGVPVG
ncbi:MAG TPA: hypothetical protein VG602_08890 [Actinomycetota bacterium]|nr:hypothetical protein [Actinomycetota bacterium]